LARRGADLLQRLDHRAPCPRPPCRRANRRGGNLSVFIATAAGSEPALVGWVTAVSPLPTRTVPRCWPHAWANAKRRLPTLRAADRRAEGFVRLRAAENAGSLERFDHLSRAKTAAQDQGPRPHLSGSVLHHLPAGLPLLPEAHGVRRLGRERLARARPIHARR